MIKGVLTMKFLYETFFDILNNFRDISRRVKSHSMRSGFTLRIVFGQQLKICVKFHQNQNFQIRSFLFRDQLPFKFLKQESIISFEKKRLIKENRKDIQGN